MVIGVPINRVCHKMLVSRLLKPIVNSVYESLIVRKQIFQNDFPCGFSAERVIPKSASAYVSRSPYLYLDHVSKHLFEPFPPTLQLPLFSPFLNVHE